MFLQRGFEKDMCSSTIPMCTLARYQWSTNFDRVEIGWLWRLVKHPEPSFVTKCCYDEKHVYRRCLADIRSPHSSSDVVGVGIVRSRVCGREWQRLLHLEVHERTLSTRMRWTVQMDICRLSLAFRESLMLLLRCGSTREYERVDSRVADLVLGIQDAGVM